MSRPVMDPLLPDKSCWTRFLFPGPFFTWRIAILLAGLVLMGCRPVADRTDVAVTAVPNPRVTPTQATVETENTKPPAAAFSPTASENSPVPDRQPTLAPATSGAQSPQGDPTTDQVEEKSDLIAEGSGSESSSVPGSAPASLSVNGIPLNRIVVMPGDVAENVRRIHRRGLRQGRDVHAFSKLGGSVAATSQFLGRWDSGPYDISPYGYLQATLEHFAGSFEREGVGTRVGMHAWAVFNPAWADKDLCRANETVIACEFRLHNPSVMLIILGTNDLDSEKFEEKLAEILEYCLLEGVIPILATKADRFSDPDDVNNGIIRRLAEEYAVPLWDFDLVAGTIPGRGIGEDEVHLTFFDEYDYTLEKAYQRGYGLYNLTALMALEEVRQQMAQVWPAS